MGVWGMVKPGESFSMKYLKLTPRYRLWRTRGKKLKIKYANTNF